MEQIEFRMITTCKECSDKYSSKNLFPIRQRFDNEVSEKCRICNSVPMTIYMSVFSHSEEYYIELEKIIKLKKKLKRII
jgi:hypothetical protein